MIKPYNPHIYYTQKDLHPTYCTVYTSRTRVFEPTIAVTDGVGTEGHQIQQPPAQNCKDQINHEAVGTCMGVHMCGTIQRITKLKVDNTNRPRGSRELCARYD